MDKINRLDYLKNELTKLYKMIAYDKYLLASQYLTDGEEAALKERIQNMEWLGSSYMKQIKAATKVPSWSAERYKTYEG